MILELLPKPEEPAPKCRIHWLEGFLIVSCACLVSYIAFMGLESLLIWMVGIL